MFGDNAGPPQLASEPAPPAIAAANCNASLDLPTPPFPDSRVTGANGQPFRDQPGLGRWLWNVLPEVKREGLHNTGGGLQLQQCLPGLRVLWIACQVVLQLQH